ncbi:MAG: hypothetical protein KC518_02200 [Candidatus Cloacimonetes bacterium]|nr:hypothetical protein [Candidatus Cloacimonadota bacterium]
MRRFRTVAVSVWLCLLLASQVIAADLPDSALPDLPALRARMQQEFQRIQSYRVRIHVDIEMPGMTVRDKSVTLFYEYPDSFRYEAKGFAVLPRRSLNMNPDSLFAGLADPVISAPDDSLGRDNLRVRGVFREGSRLAEMEYRIDTLHWVPTHLLMRVDGQLVMELETHYQVAQGLWLPAHSEIRMTLQKDLQEFYEKLKMPMRRRKNLQEGLGRIAISYDPFDLELRTP